MKIQTYFLFIIISVVTLTSCSTINSNFDCPNCAGVMCKSMDEINTMVDSGQIRGRTQTSCDKVSPHAEFQTFMANSEFYEGAPLRYGETVQRIWLAPFEDQDKNYHEESYLYAVIQDGHWIGRPVKVPVES